ncbi:GDP-mannose 4,6-dehydratase [Actinotalea sp. K2]|nr:GDP-mannose 4,6-dehydratase [Actinotalea sp. K2]
MLITGITGQDGGYLAEQLATAGMQVHGLVRPHDTAVSTLRERVPSVVVHEADLADHARLRQVVDDVEPDQLYNLAGISSVAYSWEHPVLTAELSGVAVAVLLDAAWQLQERTGHPVACVQASSAEIFGSAAQGHLDEQTPVRPINPYGVAKAYAHHMAGVYRTRGLHVASCILFNHESPRRPTTFVTRKITAGAARIGLEGSGVLRLGNLDARRDWGWAPDYVDAMVRAASRDVAADYVIATGEAHSVAEFAEAALRRAGVGDQWRDHVVTDPTFVRPTDAAVQVGDASRAHSDLGWSPTVGFTDIVHRMVDHDTALLQGDDD